MTFFLGIRHHGPGSAKSLLSALEQVKPDIVLLEGAADIDGVFSWLKKEGLKPPVAVLAYNPQNLRQAAYYPYSEFSPEWVAMKYAIAAGIPFRNIDFPLSAKWNLDNAEQETIPDEAVSQLEEKDPELLEIVRDPIGYLGKLAGFEDGERWWEVVVEQRSAGGLEVFEAVAHMIRALRYDEQGQPTLPESLETLRREAFMRQEIKRAEKEMYSVIAVVCGAWHVPALEIYPKVKSKDDEALIKGLKKTKIEATWIPWTYDRIATSSGYGAGVLSPAWYKLLYRHQDQAVQLWMIEAARLLRSEGKDTGAAHVIEAVRLAETLAAVKSVSLPGIQELRDAAVAVFCGGYEAPMKLIEQKLVIGDEIGEVPEEIPQLPLQADIMQQAKSLRIDILKADKTALELDLREEKPLAKSHFLHRLEVIGVPFAAKKSNSARTQGSFKEQWELHWKPEYMLSVIEAGAWGNTLFDASNRLLIHKAKESDALAEIAQCLDMALLSALDPSIESICIFLEEKAAVSNDVIQLMGSLNALVSISKYGDVRGTAVASVKRILIQIVPRICIGLPPACANLSEEAAELIYPAIAAAQHAIALSGEAEYRGMWHNALFAIAEAEASFPSLAGLSSRLLFDASAEVGSYGHTLVYDSEKAAQAMSLALTMTFDPLRSSKWLEGFLHGSGLLLIHHQPLWSILDQWIESLPTDESFRDYLPLLRRTFSKFSKPEREKMLQQAKREGSASSQVAAGNHAVDEERAAKMDRVLEMLMGTTV